MSVTGTHTSNGKSAAADPQGATPGARRSALRRRGLMVAAIVAVLLGVYARFDYSMRLHPATTHIVSDARRYLESAVRLAQEGSPQSARDAIWPPATAAILALSLEATGALRLAQWAILLLSVLAILFSWGFARALGSPALAAAAIIPAALAVAPIHFSGFFLSEVPGIAAVSLALMLSARCLQAPQGSRASQAALAAGLSWGLAATVRAQNLLVGLAVLGLVSLIRGRRDGMGASMRVLLMGTSAFMLSLAPFAVRCSELTGHLCLVSGNSIFNSVIGFSGDVGSVQFADATWAPPAKLQHSFEGSVKIPASMFDNAALAKWLVERISGHPLDALVALVGNGLDLFGTYLWFGSGNRVPTRFYLVGQQLFLFLVVFPAFAVAVRRAEKGSDVADAKLLLVATLGVVIVVHACSIGEPRYRLPYDPILCALAGAFFVGERPRIEGRQPSRSSVALLATLFLVWAMVVLAVAPSRPLESALAPLRARMMGPALMPALRGECVSDLPENGARWDSPGHSILGIDEGAQFRLREVSHGARATVSVDWNDLYRLSFMRGEERVGESYAMPHKPGERGGMVRYVVAAPASAVERGYDSVIVTALAGDGRASVAGVLCPAEAEGT